MKYRYYKSSGNSNYIYRVDKKGRVWNHPITEVARKTCFSQDGKIGWRSHGYHWEYPPGTSVNSVGTKITELSETEVFTLLL